MCTASQHTPLLSSSFNLSNSIFIRLKIRIDVNIALSYRYLLHIKDWTGRSQRSILHQFVVQRLNWISIFSTKGHFINQP